jgi:hypothetical protein
VTDAAGELHVVALELHARPAPEPEAATGQLGRDLVDGDREAGGKPFDHDRQGRAVRLAGGQEAQHSPPRGDLRRVFADERTGRPRRGRGRSGGYE